MPHRTSEILGNFVKASKELEEIQERIAMLRYAKAIFYNESPKGLPAFRREIKDECQLETNNGGNALILAVGVHAELCKELSADKDFMKFFESVLATSTKNQEPAQPPKNNRNDDLGELIYD